MSGIMSLLLGQVVSAAAYTEYKIFTASGSWVCPTGVTQVEYLVVAGGGGGCSGGGGAGGFRTGTGLSVTAGTNYTVTVGGGGAAGKHDDGTSRGTDGSNSVFSTITSAGGGGAGGQQPVGSGNPNVHDGRAGGSGGGGGGAVTAGAVSQPVSR